MQDEIFKLPFEPLLCGEGVCGLRCEDTFVHLDTCFQIFCVLGIGIGQAGKVCRI